MIGLNLYRRCKHQGHCSNRFPIYFEFLFALTKVAFDFKDFNDFLIRILNFKVIRSFKISFRFKILFLSVSLPNSCDFISDV